MLPSLPSLATAQGLEGKTLNKATRRSATSIRRLIGGADEFETYLAAPDARREG